MYVYRTTLRSINSFSLFFSSIRIDLIHITCKGSGASPAQDIQPFEQQLFNDTNEKTILWTMYFHIPQCMKCQHNLDAASGNVHIACGPIFELDYDETIRRAKKMFHEIYRDEEFLPRAPDPEEIIIEGDAVAITDDVDSTLIEENDGSPARDNASSSAGDSSDKAIADSGKDCQIDTNE